MSGVRVKLTDASSRCRIGSRMLKYQFSEQPLLSGECRRQTVQWRSGHLSPDIYLSGQTCHQVNNYKAHKPSNFPGIAPDCPLLLSSKLPPPRLPCLPPCSSLAVASSSRLLLLTHRASLEVLTIAPALLLSCLSDCFCLLLLLPLLHLLLSYISCLSYSSFLLLPSPGVEARQHHLPYWRPRHSASPRTAAHQAGGGGRQGGREGAL